MQAQTGGSDPCWIGYQQENGSVGGSELDIKHAEPIQPPCCFTVTAAQQVWIFSVFWFWSKGLILFQINIQGGSETLWIKLINN